MAFGAAAILLIVLVVVGLLVVSPPGKRASVSAPATPSRAATEVPFSGTSTAHSAVASALPQVFLASANDLANERLAYQRGDTAVVRVVSSLAARATKDLAVAPVSVVTKPQTPPSGDLHDYMSLSVYAWPQPGAAPGAPYIIKDGQRNPEIATIPDKQNLVNVVGWTQDLAYAYFFTGNESFAAKAAQLINAWFVDPDTRMNPSLKYAQAVKGVSTGQAGGIIDTANLPSLVDAVGLLEGSSSWTNVELASLRSWFSSYLNWLQTSAQGVAEANTTNNHATWYDVQVMSYALFTGQVSAASSIATAAEAGIIGKQIKADGSQPAELARTDSWSYSTYNVEALAMLANLADRANVDLWDFQSASGGSIRKALDSLTPYAAQLIQWPYPQSRAATNEYLTFALFAAADHFRDPAYLAAARTQESSSPAESPPVSALFYQP